MGRREIGISRDDKRSVAVHKFSIRTNQAHVCDSFGCARHARLMRMRAAAAMARRLRYICKTPIAACE
jgi:hypothetical protein